MEEAIVMKIIIGLTIIIILGFIYLLRENKVLHNKVSRYGARSENYEDEVYGLREQLTEQEHRVSTMNHRLDAYELRLDEYEHWVDEHRHRLSQQGGLIEQIRHRVDAHEDRLFP